MSEDKLGALVPEMNLSIPAMWVPSNTTVAGRRHVRGARAPILPRVILLACFDPSSKRVRIANVMWRVEDAFITCYCTHS